MIVSICQSVKLLTSLSNYLEIYLSYRSYRSYLSYLSISTFTFGDLHALILEIECIRWFLLRRLTVNDPIVIKYEYGQIFILSGVLV